jgi:ATP/maltotriose-dependent transcriptional regulator MalT
MLLHQAHVLLSKLREPQEVVGTDIASAEAYLLAGQPEQALTLIERALAAAAALHAVTLLPAAHRVQAAAMFATGAVDQARSAVAAGLRESSSSPDVGHERAFLLAVAARIASEEDDADAERLDGEARAALESLGVVHVSLVDFGV